MIRFFAMVLATLLIITGYPWPGFAARRIAVVVAPSRHGDAASAEVVSRLRNALHAHGAFHVIDGPLAEHVIDYYDDYSDPGRSRFPNARNYLGRAQDHYFGMHYEEAGAEAARAIALLENDPASLDEKGQMLFDALMTQGLIARAVKEDALMRRAFSRAAQLNPRYLLNKNAYPPSVIRTFNSERDGLVQNGVGAVAVTTRPPAAEVFLNGILNGVTPVTLENLPPGTYALMIKTNKYAPVTKMVEVKPNKTVRISLRLRWVNGQQGGSTGAADTDNRREIDECLRNAELLKADRGVLIAHREMADGSGFVRVRMVDREYRAAYKPIVAPYDAMNRAQVFDGLATEVAKMLQRPIASDPATLADLDGTADPILLGKNKKKIHRQPLFWGAIGTAVAGAVAGGVLAALNGGSSSEGSVRIQFK